MAGLGTPPRSRGGEPRVPAIHAFACQQDVDARDEPAHDVDQNDRNLL